VSTVLIHEEAVATPTAAVQSTINPATPQVDDHGPAAANMQADPEDQANVA
jgi:hypothetical protein